MNLTCASAEPPTSLLLVTMRAANEHPTHVADMPMGCEVVGWGWRGMCVCVPKPPAGPMMPFNVGDEKS